MPTLDAQRPLSSVDELVQHFALGCKPRERFQVGMEHEKIAVLADGRAPGYDVIGKLLVALAARGWTGIYEHEQLIALDGGQRGNVTLEPGGQLEHSGAPWSSAIDAVRDNDAHIDEVTAVAAELGVTFLGVGFRPFGTLDDVPWMPKGRYRVMRVFLPKRGRLGLEMMKRTATVQANLDYGDEADAMHKLRVSLALSSVVTALFAASPIVDGRVSGYQSYRAAAWLDTDPARCGLLPFAFADGARFRDYAEWALDVPMFFVYRHGEYREVDLTFRRFMKEGFGDERANAADWELHLSTLFPEVRLKRYIEVRQADASTRELARALPALWRGLLYDAEALRAAWALVGGWSYDERLALYRETPRLGLRARVAGRTLREIAAELVPVAQRGLIALGKPDAAKLLEPLDHIARSGRTVADRIIDAHTASGGEPSKLIPALTL